VDVRDIHKVGKRKLGEFYICLDVVGAVTSKKLQWAPNRALLSGGTKIHTEFLWGKCLRG
jgi:hypothetical protein